MATNRGNSSGDESVIMENDDGITVQSNRTTTHIKSRIFVPKNNECVVIERGVNGSFVTVNRLKRFGFIKRKDKTEWPDIFAREPSLIDRVRPKKFFVGDTCQFDITKTPRGYEAININIVERNINSIAKLPKIPKKKQADPKQIEISGELFHSTLAMLFREAMKKN